MQPAGRERGDAVETPILHDLTKTSTRARGVYLQRRAASIARRCFGCSEQTSLLQTRLGHIDGNPEEKSWGG
eukprot:5602972-Pleurochrysis_carterae.AAC.1